MRFSNAVRAHAASRSSGTALKSAINISREHWDLTTEDFFFEPWDFDEAVADEMGAD